MNSRQLIGVDLSSFILIADVSTRATMTIYILYSWEIETAIYIKTIVFDVQRVYTVKVTHCQSSSSILNPSYD